MDKIKKGLGRGLSSLIGDSEIKTSKDKISISSIVPNKNQPRKSFEKNSLDDLTNSIKERGIIQPLIVRKSDDQSDKFELIAGERRWQAAQMDFFVHLHLRAQFESYHGTGDGRVVTSKHDYFNLQR